MRRWPSVCSSTHGSWGREVENAHILPRNALRGENSVYVVEEDGVLRIRDVSVIDSNPDRVIVANGVENGDLVVVSPIRGASDGMRVQTYGADGEMIAEYSATYDESTDGEDDAETDNGDAGGEEAVASAG